MLLKSKQKHNKESEKKSKNKQKKKKLTSMRVKEKEHYFSDVRLFKWMPWLFGFALLLLFIAGGWSYSNNHQYNVAQTRKSMKEGTQLPILNKGAADKGTLTLGNSILSKDHKQMAVTIKYDDKAHQALSSFGTGYRLWLVATDGYPVEDIHVKYGIFGTDGSGVLQITSDKPFKNEAFVIMIVDTAKLTTTEQAANGSTVDDSTINKSITAQLSNGTLDGSDDMSDSSSSTANSNVPPIYYMRLNPYSAKQTDVNWDNNEVELVDTLFIHNNLEKIKDQVEKNKKQLKEAKNTLEEYNKRLKINPDDQIAQQGKQDQEGQIEQLQQNVESANKKYQKIKNTRLSNNILGEEQTKNKVKVVSQAKFDTLQGGDTSGN
ncbi:hypothetical protein ACWCL1_08235 [Ligilactobacillus sp. LYQ135]